MIRGHFTKQCSSSYFSLKFAITLSFQFLTFTATLEDVQILERISPDTLVFLQTHKRIWPASQRDAMFWSHMGKVNDNVDADAHDVWIVCNHSADEKDYPVSIIL